MVPSLDLLPHPERPRSAGPSADRPRPVGVAWGPARSGEPACPDLPAPSWPVAAVGHSRNEPGPIGESCFQDESYVDRLRGFEAHRGAHQEAHRGAHPPGDGLPVARHIPPGHSWAFDPLKSAAPVPSAPERSDETEPGAILDPPPAKRLAAISLAHSGRTNGRTGGAPTSAPEPARVPKPGQSGGARCRGPSGAIAWGTRSVRRRTLPPLQPRTPSPCPSP